MLTKKDLEKIREVVTVPLKEDIAFLAKTTKESFDEVDNKFIAVNQKIDSLTTAVDGFAKNQLKFDAELAALTNQSA